MDSTGQRIYTAIFKRLWRSSKEEFEKLYTLNALHGSQEIKQLFSGRPEEICPVADPNVTSDSQRVATAGMIIQMSGTVPGFDKDEAVRNYLRAAKVENIDKIFPGTKGTPPPEDPKILLEKTKHQGAMELENLRIQAAMQRFVIEVQEEQSLNQAKIIELQAKAQNEAANAQTEQAYAQVAMINAEIGRLKVMSNHYNAQIDRLLRAAEIQSAHHIGIRGLENGQRAKEAA
jgi:hypothetical protein